MGQTRAAIKAGVALAIGAAAFPAAALAAGSRSTAPSVERHGREVLVKEPVSSTGLFDVTVAVSAQGASNVEVRIGKVGRRARIAGAKRHATVHARIPINGHTLTVRASGASAPTIVVALQRIGNWS